MRSLEHYFKPFRKETIGYHQPFRTPYGKKKMIYADWTAAGRLYRPIEKQLCDVFGPFMGNTHSHMSETGEIMTKAYHHALQIIKDHVGAKETDVILATGFGATSALNKLQRILGLRIHEKFRSQVYIPSKDRPVVFLTHMEHHSNHISWLETLADVVCLEPDSDGLVSPDILEKELQKYRGRTLKIGSFTACSNVTGIQPPIYKLAKMMHEYNGLCFADFSASAPYKKIHMHNTEAKNEDLDALFFSPHKFLGGPGSAGILIFHSKLYTNAVPDHPGGGTVEWTNPWNGRKYFQDIQMREDGGTPGILQTIKAALSVQLKQKMNMDLMEKREEELTRIFLKGLKEIPQIRILAGHIEKRLGIVSFCHETLHYNLFVKLLNDRFGIQARGGCSCAGTYGHYLLGISKERSKTIIDQINQGNLSGKPGWVRISIHPIMTNQEIHYMVDSIREIAANGHQWETDYMYSSSHNEFFHKSGIRLEPQAWFQI